MGKLAVGLAVLLAGLSAAAPAEAVTPPGRGDLRVRPNAFLFGQAPDWLDARTWSTTTPRVATRAATAQVQIWRARLDGSARRCLTCGLDGPESGAGGAARRAGGSSSTPGAGTRRGSGARVRRHRLGRVGDDARRAAPDQPHGERRAQRQLPRLLVARRPLDRLDLAQLERRRGRERPLGRPRRALRPERPQRPAAGGRARGAAPERALVRDAVVGAGRLGLPLHRDRGHGDQPGALLLPAPRPRHAGAAGPRGSPTIPPGTSRRCSRRT